MPMVDPTALGPLGFGAALGLSEVAMVAGAIGFLVGGVVGALCALLPRRPNRSMAAELAQPGAWPISRSKLLTTREADMLGRIVDCLPQYQVFPQVSLAAFMRVVAQPSRRRALRSVLGQLSVAYLVCRDGKPVLAVDFRESPQRDDVWRQSKLAALGAARIPHVTISDSEPTIRLQSELVTAVMAASQSPRDGQARSRADGGPDSGSSIATESLAPGAS